jgi:hypothetical protein
MTRKEPTDISRAGSAKFVQYLIPFGALVLIFNPNLRIFLLGIYLFFPFPADENDEKVLK